MIHGLMGPVKQDEIITLCKNPFDNQHDLINGTPLLWTVHTLNHTFEAFPLHLACLNVMSFGHAGKVKVSIKK